MIIGRVRLCKRRINDGRTVGMKAGRNAGLAPFLAALGRAARKEAGGRWWAKRG